VAVKKKKGGRDHAHKSMGGSFAELLGRQAEIDGERENRVFLCESRDAPRKIEEAVREEFHNLLFAIELG